MKNLLWISMFAPISKASSGGSQTFNYYFKRFLKSGEFNIRLISCGKYAEKEYIDFELIDVTKHIIYWNKPNSSRLGKLINIESKFNIFNRNANLISNTTVKEVLACAKRYKAEGFYPDVVILEWTEMLMLAQEIKQIFPNSKVIASEHDVTFIGYNRKKDYYTGIKKWVWNLKYKREKKIELSALQLCDLILPHNSDNKDVLIHEGLKEEKIYGLVPYFKNMKSNTRCSNKKDILFFGAMGRPENSLSAIWFIENVLPKLGELNYRFVVLGSNPPEELLRMESDKIYITGFVDDITPFFIQSACLVAPLVLGAGIKIKVLEAMSSGIPVFTNILGIEGIPAQDGQEYVHCETVDDYVNSINNLFANDTVYEEMGQRAKLFINDRFSPDAFYEKYRVLINNLI